MGQVNSDTHPHRFSRVLKTALAISLALALGSVASAQDEQIPYDTPGEIPQLDPDYRRTSHKVVLITDEALSPRTVTLDEGQLVAWISYSAAPSKIVFPREVAKSMICHSLVNFSIADGVLSSAEIHPGEFASFCELKSGRYRYRVTRKDTKAATSTGARPRLEGEIIVGNPG